MIVISLNPSDKGIQKRKKKILNINGLNYYGNYLTTNY